MGNIERSREIRQWIKLIVNGVSTAVVVDYMATEGKNTKNVCNWIKSKWADLRRPRGIEFPRKEESE